MKNNMPHLLEKHFDTALESPDGIKKLRELILTLAMQGKLVKQDPKDQPASELLKEIQAEKERLIKEGKIKKQKKLPLIKPEEVPYEVPEGWVWTRLGEIAELIGGFAYDSKEFKSFGDNQVLRLGNIRPDMIRLDEHPVFIDEKRAKETSAFQLHIGDIIITMTGTRAKRDYLYTVRVLENPINGKTLFLNQRVGVIRLFFDSTFLNKALKHETLKNIIYQTSTGSANQANIGMLALKNWTIPLPPLIEQRRIIAKIDELMTLCDKLEAQSKARNERRLAVHTSAINSLLTASDKKEFDTSWQFITRHFDPLYSVKENMAELKKAILTLAMHGKLVKQDPNDQPASELLKEIQAEKERLIKERKIKKQKKLPPIKPEEVPYEVPVGWVCTRLGNIFSFEYGNNLPSEKRTNTGEYPVYGSNGVVGTHNKATINNKCIVIGRKGSAGALNLSLSIGCWVTDVSYFCVPPKNVDLLFTFNLFKKMSLDELGKGIKPGLNRNEAYIIPIPLPPLAEQKRIVAKIDELMALCDKLENQIDHATAKQTALFDAVLAKV